MNDYTHRAKRQNKSDIVSSVCAYISAAVLYFSSIFVDGIKYVPVLQFLALVFIVTGVFINQRHTWLSFVYGVVPRENKNSGETDGEYFVVYRVQGKRQSCLAKIDMNGLISVIKCTHNDDGKSEISRYKNPTCYNFCISMMPAAYTRAVFYADGGIVVISFEPDSTLSAILERAPKRDVGSINDTDIND